MFKWCSVNIRIKLLISLQLCNKCKWFSVIHSWVQVKNNVVQMKPHYFWAGRASVQERKCNHTLILLFLTIHHEKFVVRTSLTKSCIFCFYLITLSSREIQCLDIVQGKFLCTSALKASCSFISLLSGLLFYIDNCIYIKQKLLVHLNHFSNIAFFFSTDDAHRNEIEEKICQFSPPMLRCSWRYQSQDRSTCCWTVCIPPHWSGHSLNRERQTLSQLLMDYNTDRDWFMNIV